MPKDRLKLLALLLALSAAPVTAAYCGSSRVAAASASKPHAHSSCPRHHAREEGSAAPARASAPSTITLTDPMPSDSLLGLGRGAGMLTP